jgi:hypothetical protein
MGNKSSKRMTIEEKKKVRQEYIGKVIKQMEEEPNKSIKESIKSIKESTESLKESNKSLEESTESLKESRKLIEESNKRIEESNKRIEEWKEQNKKNSIDNIEKYEKYNNEYEDMKNILSKNINEAIDTIKNLESTDINVYKNIIYKLIEEMGNSKKKYINMSIETNNSFINLYKLKLEEYSKTQEDSKTQEH